MSIHKKINEVMKLVKGVEKSSTNKHGNYHYAGHEAVTGTLRAHFARIGIVRSVNMFACDVLDGGAVRIGVDVSYTDIEDPTAPLVCRMFALQHCQTKSGAITAQQVGQALSYAVKNAEFKLFALTGDTEPDSDSTAGESEEPSTDPQALQARARELLQLVGSAESKAQLDDALEQARAEIGELKTVKGFVESMKAMREGAEIKLGLKK